MSSHVMSPQGWGVEVLEQGPAPWGFPRVSNSHAPESPQKSNPGRGSTEGDDCSEGQERRIPPRLIGLGLASDEEDRDGENHCEPNRHAVTLLRSDCVCSPEVTS